MNAGFRGMMTVAANTASRRFVVRKAIRFLERDAGVDLIIDLDTSGQPCAVRGRVYHWSYADGPCPQMELGRFRVPLSECLGIDAAQEAGARAGRAIASLTCPDPLEDMMEMMDRARSGIDLR